MFTCSIYTGSSPPVTGYFLQVMKKIKGLSAWGNSYGETPGMNRTSKIKWNKTRKENQQGILGMSIIVQNCVLEGLLFDLKSMYLYSKEISFRYMI